MSCMSSSRTFSETWTYNLPGSWILLLCFAPMSVSDAWAAPCLRRPGLSSSPYSASSSSLIYAMAWEASLALRSASALILACSSAAKRSFSSCFFRWLYAICCLSFALKSVFERSTNWLNNCTFSKSLAASLSNRSTNRSEWPKSVDWPGRSWTYSCLSFLRLFSSKSVRSYKCFGFKMWDQMSLNVVILS